MANPDERDWMEIIAVVLAFIVILNVISYFWFPFLPWTQQRDAGKKIVESQMDADKALQDYRWFREQWFDIQAQRRQIENAYEEEKQFHRTYGNDSSEWGRQAQERHGRLHDRITGNKNVLEQMVAKYNARSSDATRAVWKCHLPYQVDERFEVAGPPGSDAPDQPTDKYINSSGPGEPPKAGQCDALPARASS